MVAVARAKTSVSVGGVRMSSKASTQRQPRTSAKSKADSLQNGDSRVIPVGMFQSLERDAQKVDDGGKERPTLILDQVSSPTNK